MKQLSKSVMKELVKRIRKLRPEVKDYQRKNGGDFGRGAYWDLGKAQYEFRHRHIARCLLRGRTIEQIERICYTKRDDTYIEELMAKAKEEAQDEALCVSTG